MKDVSKARFPVILLCSVVFHVGVLAILYGAWLYHVALKFGDITFDSGGEAKYKVAMLDRTKPLWQMYLVDGYRGGAAIVSRIHHAVADGIATHQQPRLPHPA